MVLHVAITLNYTWLPESVETNKHGHSKLCPIENQGISMRETTVDPSQTFWLAGGEPGILNDVLKFLFNQQYSTD